MNGTDHETALRLALGVLADSTEPKDTDSIEGVCITPDDPFEELCDRLKGFWADVCHDNRDSTWYFMWDGKITETGFTVRDEAKTALLEYIVYLGHEVPNDFLTADDQNPAHLKRITTACIRTGE